METSNKSYHVYFDNEIESVVMEWYGYSNSSEFRQGTELMLNTLIKEKTFKVLADVKQMTLIGTDDQQWLNYEFLPRATEFGFKVIAIVKPDQYFNKVAMENISSKADQNKIAIKLFDTVEQAREWLSLL